MHVQVKQYMCIHGFNVTVTHLPVIQWILKLHQ